MHKLSFHIKASELLALLAHSVTQSVTVTLWVSVTQVPHSVTDRDECGVPDRYFCLTHSLTSQSPITNRFVLLAQAAGPIRQSLRKLGNCPNIHMCQPLLNNKGVVRNYVPIPSIYVPRTLKTKYPVLSKPCNLYLKLQVMYAVPSKPSTSTRNLTKRSGIPFNV